MDQAEAAALKKMQTQLQSTSWKFIVGSRKDVGSLWYCRPTSEEQAAGDDLRSMDSIHRVHGMVHR